MADHTLAVDGTNFMRARPFAFAFNAAGSAVVNKDCDPGSYYLVATTAAALVRVKETGGTDVTALPSTQPAASAHTDTLYCPLEQPMALDIAADAGGTQMQLSVLGFTAVAGTLVVIGPIARSTNR